MSRVSLTKSSALPRISRSIHVDSVSRLSHPFPATVSRTVHRSDRPPATTVHVSRDLDVRASVRVSVCVCIFGVCVSCPVRCTPDASGYHSPWSSDDANHGDNRDDNDNNNATTLTIEQWLNENGRPQGTEMDELRDAQLSHRILSLSYRPEGKHNVRVPAVSSSKVFEVVPKSRPAVEEESSRGGSRDARPQPKQWSSMNVLDYLRPVNLDRSAERTIEAARIGKDETKDRIRIGSDRPHERAAADCNWHAGMLEGRSKSFVLPDHCLRRSGSPIGDRSTAIRSTLLQATTDEQHRHRHRHHHHHHHHHHHQRVSPTSSSSTSSSTISSTNHVMLPSPSSTTSSVIIGNAHLSASRVRGYNIIDK